MPPGTSTERGPIGPRRVQVEDLPLVRELLDDVSVVRAGSLTKAN